MNDVDFLAIIHHFYRDEPELELLLLHHSKQVCDKALQIMYASGRSDIDGRTVICGAMLHDIGIIRCNAPGILCCGKEDYISHGVCGREMLAGYSAATGVELECFGRICERHTGSGLTAADVINQKLPLEVRDYLPETPEEKLICLADKFFSKSGKMHEKPLDKVRHSMAKFGKESAERFEQLCAEFNLY